MRYALVSIKPLGAKRVKKVRLEVIKDERRGDTRIVSGYKVNKEGNYIGPQDVDEIQVLVGARKVEELEEDYKYGELVPVGTASQHTARG